MRAHALVECIIEEPMAFQDGNLVLTDKPGLGLEWKEEALREFAPPAGGSL